MSKEEAAKYGIVKKKVTLESEFETIKNVSLKLLKILKNNVTIIYHYFCLQIDINNWENKRGPRPWESAPES